MASGLTPPKGLTGSPWCTSPASWTRLATWDPAAEADVYLAYGRDLQAEEILKEALRNHTAARGHPRQAA